MSSRLSAEARKVHRTFPFFLSFVNWGRAGGLCCLPSKNTPSTVVVANLTEVAFSYVHPTTIAGLLAFLFSLHCCWFIFSKANKLSNNMKIQWKYYNSMTLLQVVCFPYSNKWWSYRSWNKYNIYAQHSLVQNNFLPLHLIRSSCAATVPLPASIGRTKWSVLPSKCSAQCPWRVPKMTSSYLSWDRQELVRGRGRFAVFVSL